jgi:hypothetical protein
VCDLHRGLCALGPYETVVMPTPPRANS